MRGVCQRPHVVPRGLPTAGSLLIATGGHANKGTFEGSDLAVSTWDVLSGAVAPGEEVLLYDDNGDHQGPSCAEFLASAGRKGEMVTPERFTGIEIGATNYPVHQRELYRAGVIFTPDMRLARIYSEGNDWCRFYATSTPGKKRSAWSIRSSASMAPCRTRISTSRSSLLRVGDAVASRNIHAAIYDSLRFCKDV